MKIYLTREFDYDLISLLKQYFEVDVNYENKRLSKQDFLSFVDNYDGIITQLYEKIDRDVIDKAEKLKIISNCAAGINNIDIEYAKEKNITVTNTPGVLSDATADLAMALLLTVARRIKEGMDLVKNGKFTGWDLQLLKGYDLTGKTVGIIGAGKIGTAFAKRTKGWDMNILYYSRSTNSFIEENLYGKKVSLEELLTGSDIISLHCPLTPETHHLIGKEQFALMKKEPILINTARGEVIDEKELIEALREGSIAGAGLDVFEFEPEVPQELSEMPNVVCTPHIGSATTTTRRKMMEMAVNSIIDYLINGKTPENKVI